jgi:hypothetical protein
MLAQFAISNRRTRPTIFLTLLVLMALSLWGTESFAADVTPTGQLDARAVGNVSGADTGDEGAMTTGISFRNTDALIAEDDLSSEAELLDNDKEVLRDSSRISAYFGASITKNIEFTLGLHGTHEIVDPSQRESHLVNTSSNDEEVAVQEDWRDSTKQTGFSGASVMAKIKLLDAEGFKLALAPFVESGAGESASYTYTRSVNPKAGWMVITSYGQQGIAEVTLNAGYRYRDPETVGDITIRNEAFAGANVKAWLTSDFAMFVGMNGRNLMVAKNGDRDSDNRLQYNGQESGEVNGGFVARLGDADLSIFLGSKMDNTAGFGFAKTSAGLSVGYEVGNYRGRRPRAGFAKEVQEDIDSEKTAKNDESIDPLKKKAPAKEEDEFEEMIGKDIDPLAQLEPSKEPDVFDEASKKTAEEAKQTGLSEDEKITQELEQIQAAEKVAEEEKRKADEAELEQKRAKQREQLEEDAELMKEWTKEAEEELGEFEGISDDEMEWNGLDH